MATTHQERLVAAWLFTPLVIKEHIRALNPRAANALDGVVVIDRVGTAVVPESSSKQH
ncbi:hypothetical protein pphageT12_15 [Pseudomonas phage pphageT12]|uniref:Uncharacterized protein n=1 Tax=Pseudomonas phage phiB1_1 TaxID=2755402 RepID=A0A7D7FG93_9CAUD|nr:hypothetical protein phiB1_1_09 [Pseudomonas phage phiB1_1]UAW53648.1 hypothetical protein pphageB21_15 [Pseudomonas phage pphageB21]UAW53707.1 hypothetical protein pphageT21_15 [Pseudomonas phage pphageT21]UAW53766.1 hypothetical protein pphageT12_15 [Pseudomonas phage pphageT12]UAW53827.1 hypothetical protein pphageBV72_15 [Pseudomonas phage pphageBV72]